MSGGERGRGGRSRGLPRWRRRCLAAGVLAIIVALFSPLDQLAEVLFSAHMVQHLILMQVAPPLLVLGAPALELLWTLPPASRRRVGRWWNRRLLLRSLLARLFHPLAAWLLALGSLFLWHLPGPYQAALRHPLVHVFEHLNFLGSGFLFWSVLLRPDRARRLEYGAGVLYSFTAALPSGLLGALLTFAGKPLYPVQSGSAPLHGLTPLQDQQLAGLIMWMPGGLIYLCVAAGWFLRWLRSEEQKTSVGARSQYRLHPGTAVLLPILATLLGSCRDREPVQRVPGGEVQQGKQAIAAYGCGSCHVIPGVRQAEGLVGPPLTGFARRSYIAGEAPNTAEQLVRWIQAPQSIEPGTAMPNLGVTEQQARNIAAYLYTLR
jgi:putative membrane protein